ncbi:MAG: T9SS type A sorting domain-containing protein, partial [Melioribacteraceae bacterium]
EKTIIANNNWWGENSSPSNNINGLVTTENWLADSLSLFIFSESDSYVVPSGKRDSILFNLVNISSLEDSLTINISDSLGWLEDSNYSIGINDTTGGSGIISFTVPNSSTVINKIMISATSVNSGKEVMKDLLISSYVPLYSDLIILEDSLTIGFGDSVNYTAMRVDQNGKESKFSTTWSSSNGSIENAGKFVADSTVGEIEIMVQDSKSNLSKTTHLYVTNEQQILSEINISPSIVNILPGDIIEFIVKGINQFGFPLDFDKVWEVTGGTIDKDGFFIAGESNGKYEVSVTDTSGNSVASAIINILVGVESESETLPKKINLSQNYPNPFNPNTTISFSIPDESFVSLIVYDILGKEIKSLVSEKKTPGVYKIEFGSNKLPSGIYFFKLVVGDHIEIRKAVLLK